jgi:hypothetical protein
MSPKQAVAVPINPKLLALMLTLPRSCSARNSLEMVFYDQSEENGTGSRALLTKAFF